ncbi:MAG: hypothetical protein KDA41_14190 [Planctomycetales bacterium]|nr:hypothetical protein [Planctomycetales bacterium]
MPRFALLLHETPPEHARPTHWDLLLEDGAALLTWALDDAPAPGAAVAAQQLPDHRREYLTYEGPVSDNRGQVSQVDAGEFEWIDRTPDELRVRLHGAALCGTLTIMRDADAEDPQRWVVGLSSK